LHLEIEALRHGHQAAVLHLALLGAGEAQRAVFLPVDRLAGLRFEPVVELDRVLQHPRGVARGAELADEARRMPGGAVGQPALFQDDDVALTGAGQVIGDGAAEDAAAEDENLGMTRRLGGFRHGERAFPCALILGRFCMHETTWMPKIPASKPTKRAVQPQDINISLADARISMLDFNRALNQQRAKLGPTTVEASMRNMFLAGAAALALIATAAPALAEVPESTDPIKIANFDWTGAVLNTKILAKILESYGYKVEIVNADYLASIGTGLPSGDLALGLEYWDTTAKEAMAEADKTARPRISDRSVPRPRRNGGTRPT
jgi:hypothetical protein